MTESTVNFLFEKLSFTIIVEATQLSLVGDEVEKIKLELENMQAFLRVADRGKDIGEELKTWVRQVREASYDMEGILNEFVYRMPQPRSRGFESLILRTIHLLKNIYYKHQFATRLQKINENVHEISARRNQYNLNQIGEGRQCSIENSIFKEEDYIVGMKKEFDLRVKWLLGEDQRLMVISVMGMGGLGKTTLVSKAFKHSEAKKDFHCFACVSVSQTLRITELLQAS